MLALNNNPMLGAICAAAEGLDGSIPVAELTVEQRIASVGPLMIAQVSNFWQRLMPREQAAESIEDLLTIVWIELREKDASYSSDRGAYTTWAVAVARHKLGEHRNRMRAVHSPRNSSGRLEKQKQSGHETRTSSAIKQALCEPVTIDRHSEVVDTRSEYTPEQQEASNALASRVGDALLKLRNPAHAKIIRMVYGISGSSPMDSDEVAAELGMPRADVDCIVAQAELALKVMLDDFGDADPEELDFADLLQ